MAVDAHSRLLVRTPEPYADESLVGYVLRVSEENGYDTPWHVFKLAGILPGRMFTAAISAQRIREVLGGPERSMPSSYGLDGEVQEVRVRGHNLGKSASAGLLRLRKPAFCPECVQEKGYIEAFWDLTAAVACPTHKRAKLQHCPKCRAPLSWFRPGLLTCHCGESLVGSKTEPVGEPVAELMGLIRAKVDGQPLASQVNSSGFPVKELEKLNLQTLLQLVQTLGEQELANRAGDMAGRVEASAVAAEVLRDWPRGFHGFLSRTGERLLSEGVRAGGLRGQFGRLYETLFKGRSWSEHLAFLREEFVAFGLHTWGRALVDGKLGGASVDEKRYVSKTEFARMHGLTKPTLERLISEGAIRTSTVNTAQSTRTVVDLQQTQSPIEKARLISVRDAAALACIPVSVLKHLREAGVYKNSPRPGHGTSWFEDDVHALVARAQALPRSVMAGPQTSLGAVMRLKFKSPTVKGMLVESVFQGRLAVLGFEGETLSGIALAKAQVDELAQQLLQKDEGSTCSLADACSATGIARAAMGDAIARGFLVVQACDSGPVRVLSSSVKTFNDRYVPVSRLAKERETSPRHLFLWCLENGFSAIELSRGVGEPAQPVMLCDEAAASMALWEQRQAELSAKTLVARRASHEDKLRSYLDMLVSRGEKLPRRAGQPNKAVIARACGFGRHVFEQAGPVSTLLTNFSRQGLVIEVSSD